MSSVNCFRRVLLDVGGKKTIISVPHEMSETEVNKVMVVTRAYLQQYVYVEMILAECFIQKIFGISFGKFIDMRFLLARKELVFNLLKFTDWLEECYPDECSIDGVSYNAVVERKFGKRGVKMIKKLIG